MLAAPLLRDSEFMEHALRLAERGYGATSPNPWWPLVVKAGRVIGRGWHHRAGEPHGEIEALNDACKKGRMFEVPHST